jgi:hypothetical protein
MTITPYELFIGLTGLLGQYYVGKLNRMGLVLWTLCNLGAIVFHLFTGLHGLVLLHSAYLAITVKDLVLWTKKGYPLSLKAVLPPANL